MKTNRGYALLTTLSLLSGCAGDFESTLNSLTGTAELIRRQQEIERGIQTVRVRFHYEDFYTLTNPNQFGCAGDTRIYYSSLDGTQDEPLEFGNDAIFQNRSLKPAFIRNVSVDLTDANVDLEQNAAFSCSYGNGLAVPPSSNCATFDFGAINGVSTSLGGSLLMLGGIEGPNYANQEDTTNGQTPALACGPIIPATDVTGEANESDVNICRRDFHALAIDSLPASAATDPVNSLVPGRRSATEPISNFALLSRENYNGPMGAAGGALVYNQALGKAVLFGGSAPLASIDITDADFTDAGYDNNDTWLFDSSSQTWTKVPTVSTASNDIVRQSDCQTATVASCTSNVLLSKAAGGRALFGYVSVPQLSLSQMSSADDPQMAAADVDFTDRIVVTGGLRGIDVDETKVYLQDTIKFNPTFGPEFVNVQSYAEANTEEYTTQWMNSFHSTPMANSESGHLLTYQDAGTNLVANFGATWGRNYTGVGNANIGYLLMAGGFITTATIVDGTVDGGHLVYTDRVGGTEDDPDVFAAVATYPFLDPIAVSATGTNTHGLELQPIDWAALADGSAGDNTDTTPEFGAMSMERGHDLTTNEVVLFGGVNCRDYILDTNGVDECPNDAANTTSSFNGNSRYYTLGADMPANMDAATAHPAPAGTAPDSAGMASARGFDGGDQPIVVAWGGIESGYGNAGDNNLYYLYDNGGTPTWVNVLPSQPRPRPAANGAMVFSHVTQKFYLFGGYETSPDFRYSDETWELSISGTCTTAGTCTFTWKRLSDDGGLTCSPYCPAARRSHRMTEANYNNQDPTSEYSDCQDGSANVCSFGIFMEGGTNNGLDTFGERWMFDPTANGGQGHWTLVNDLPPRRFHHAVPISYFVPSLQRTVHRVLMFGGETGLESPGQTSGTDQVFVAPTLGDTQMFDFETNQWHRVKLLGKGFRDNGADFAHTTAASTTFASGSEKDHRQAYIANDTNTYRSLLGVLTPPPIAGGVMVARTFPSATDQSTSTVEPLKIPGAYLVGGRLKDGLYNTLDNVYKFCAGSTGEEYQTTWANTDGTCDAYDADDNPNSPSPSPEYEGRWLKKTPPDVSGTITDGQDPTGLRTYLGAGTYDPKNDLFLLLGGLTPDGANTRVTQTRQIFGDDGTDFFVYEYTFQTVSNLPGSTNVGTPNAPTAAQIRSLNGYWTRRAACNNQNQPSGRYGHSMAYDPLNKQIIVVGGLNGSDAALTQAWEEDDGTTSTLIPEIWVAKRELTATVSGTSATTQYCYDWRQITTFGNLSETSDTIGHGRIPLNGRAHLSTAFVPSTGYNTGYYSTFDDSCVGQGPIATDDPDTNSQLIGGMYFHLDRSELGPNENLLFSLTYIALGDDNRQPNNAFFDAKEEIVFEVNLLRAGLSAVNLEQLLQPRSLSFIDESVHPKVVSRFAVMAQPNGQIKQEQIMLPISMDDSINLIEVKRKRGSTIAIDASLHRWGYR